MPYPATRRDKRGWCVEIKTKPMSYIEFDHVQDDVPYQVEEMSHVNEVIEVESISGLQDLRGGVEEVYPINLLTSEEESNNLNGESNNIEQDNEGEIEDDFEVYNS